MVNFLGYVSRKILQLKTPYSIFIDKKWTKCVCLCFGFLPVNFLGTLVELKTPYSIFINKKWTKCVCLCFGFLHVNFLGTLVEKYCSYRLNIVFLSTKMNKCLWVFSQIHSGITGRGAAENQSTYLKKFNLLIITILWTLFTFMSSLLSNVYSLFNI